jgi:RNA polymerase sigma-70 factor, ECF subfamily
VRNTCYTWMQQNRLNEFSAVFDEEIHGVPSDASSPEAMPLESVDKKLLKEALEELPLEFREALVMRELEGMSYKEIAGAAGVPPGTVMSRLARARKRLQQCLTDGVKREPDSIPTIRRT